MRGRAHSSRESPRYAFLISFAGASDATLRAPRNSESAQPRMQNTQADVTQ